MNIQFVLAIISGLVCYSPKAKEPLMLVAQFSIYVDANAYQEGEFIPYYSGKVDQRVYEDDCQAFYDLTTFRREICDERELLRIQELLNQYNKPKANNNKL